MADETRSSGDPTASEMARLVAEHHKPVYRYAFRLVGSVPDAEDLTQQVFLAAQENLQQLRSPEAVRSWLFAILRNCFFKSRQKRSPVLAESAGLNIESIPEEAPLGDSVDTERLGLALDALPAKYRLVLAMFYFEECSYREIAQRLELPMGTVMSRLARAKGRLRAKLLEAGATYSDASHREHTTAGGTRTAG